MNQGGTGQEDGGEGEGSRLVSRIQIFSEVNSCNFVRRAALTFDDLTGFRHSDSSGAAINDLTQQAISAIKAEAVNTPLL